VANLLDNAIKHGMPQTGNAARVIEIAAAPDPARSGRGVILSVGDHGPGIPEEERQHVLERFVRLEASRNTPGSGLGLSLVAAVARLHGGVIELADNDPGLRVTLSLPVSGR
ncbi:MAG: sensor histidine kinase, partial [Parvibaculaceae bacterium]